jgi:hypothetical protein
MKDTVRVSFDVPADEHIFLKTACVEARIPFRNLMKQVFHKTVEKFKKEKLRKLLTQGIKEAKEGKGRIISQEELDTWAKMVDDE